jgi:organic radical activating enzyme
VYCGHEASSVWATLKGVAQSRTDYGENLDGLLEFIAKHKSTIRNLALLGGEPLLQKENEMLLEQLNKDANINVITNLNVPLE